MNKKSLLNSIIVIIVMVIISLPIGAQEFISLKTVGKAAALPKYHGDASIGYATNNNYFVETSHGVTLKKIFFVGLGAAYQTNFDGSTAVPIFATFKATVPNYKLFDILTPYAYVNIGYAVDMGYSGEIENKEFVYINGIYSAVGIGVKLNMLTLGIGWRMNKVDNIDHEYIGNNGYGPSYRAIFEEATQSQFSIKIGCEF